MPRVRTSAPRDLEQSRSLTRGDTKLTSTRGATLQHKSDKTRRPSKPGCDPCRPEVRKVIVPAAHVRTDRVRVRKELPCPSVGCEDANVCARVAPQRVGARDVGILVKPKKVKLGPDYVDVDLHYGKWECEAPKVHFEVKTSEAQVERQNIHIEVLEQKYSKDGPIVKIHGPAPPCRTLKPEVTYHIEEPKPVCVPEPNITVTYRKAGCDKPVVYDKLYQQSVASH